MTETQLTLVWIVTGVVCVGGLVWLLTRWIQNSKTTPGAPTTTQYDTQDAPPSDSEKV